MERLSGSALFARYAYAPNELGYCGPDDAARLLEHSSSGHVDEAISRRARQFDGAWAYLEIIAAAAAIHDPLDPRVVEAYWVGNGLLDGVDPSVLLAGLAARFHDQIGGFWDEMPPDIAALALPHHSFHVFAVYPWVALLGSGTEVPLRVLDRCRIRWGEVVSVDDQHAVVRSRPLTWDGHAVALGPARYESARWSSDGGSLLDGVSPGDTVSLHWDWICDRLSGEQLRALERSSARQLHLTNLYLRRSDAGSPSA